MNTIRYLLDEHVNPLYRTELLKLEPSMTVWGIGILGAPLKGTLDPDILRWCEENHFILVTNNRRSMPRHLQDHLAEGRHMPGIIQLNPNISIGEVIDDLLLIWATLHPDEFRDQIVYLPL